MTYSPLPGTTHQDKQLAPSPDHTQPTTAQSPAQTSGRPISDEQTSEEQISDEQSLEGILRRVSCLLQCPIDTPQLWPQVLSVIGEALSCETAQLWWSVPLVTPVHHWGEGAPPNLGDGTTLWQNLSLPKPFYIDSLWCTQAVDLQAQLAELVAGGRFQIVGSEIHSAGQWSSWAEQIFGACADRHLLLLPIRYEQDCVGVLGLLRNHQWGVWTPEEVRQVETAGTQVYLAVQRWRVERLFRTRSARDQLTQLPDRMLFNQQLKRAIAQSIEADVMLGVAFLDLDRFKNINDTLGHAAGDCLLKQVAERLQSCLRGYDVVARWGGDEFTLLLSELRSPEEISLIAERILQRLAAPFRVQEEELFVTASLGIALAPYDGEDEQTLLRNADAAMYQAKARGRNNYQIYFEEINADARTQLNLETDLRKALHNQELFLCYQPQVNLKTGEWIGMEALIRWQHPTLGLISPTKFIPIAEETGLIEPIGQWVLQAACSQYAQWQQAGMPPLRLAVNLSAQQFHRSRLVRSVVRILEATHFDARHLELEVTESAAMQDVGFAISVLQKLSHVGIQIAMDDFGTGYSSLSVLKHFPLDTIKIDRSFVQDLVDNPNDAAIASTIIALAKGLNFKVLAEGIETAAQMSVLQDMGCDYAQGYWFSRPLTVQQIDELLLNKTFEQRSGVAVSQ
ncbi:MAG: EAL domain-containing protein [Cyanobacteria bacterium J06623_5]